MATTFPLATSNPSVRRFASTTVASRGLTAGHSKKIENHVHHLHIYFLFYNLARVHSSLRMSPAMAAGIATRLWTIEDIVRLMDADEMRIAA